VLLLSFTLFCSLFVTPLSAFADVEHVTIEADEDFHERLSQIEQIIIRLEERSEHKETELFSIQSRLKTLAKDYSLLRAKCSDTEEGLRSLETAISQPVYLFHAAEKQKLRDSYTTLASSKSEVVIRLADGEPTVVKFSEKILGGFKRAQAPLAIERQDDAIIIFSFGTIRAQGEAILVRGESGNFYALRIEQATKDNPRDVKISVSMG
jgi:septal ring factor EnvC (AmiA/AmiB activator)